MAEDAQSGTTDAKLQKWVKDILGRVAALLETGDLQDASAEYFRIDQEELAPVLAILSGDDRRERAAQSLRSLREGLDRLFLNPPSTEPERKQAMALVSRAGMALKESMKPAEAEPEIVMRSSLRDLPWRTYMDDEGHITFDAGAGHVVPIRGDVRGLAKRELLAEAIRQQPAYPEAVRPKNMRGDPGALLQIRDAKRLIVVGDLHGRYDNLELILADKDNWNAVKDGSAHLLFLGDSIHPQSSKLDQEAANLDSFRVLFLILSLRAENPGTVHYIVGNHENAHCGGLSTGKGDMDQLEGFEAFVQEHLGDVLLHAYEEFLSSCPMAVKLRMDKGGALVAVHASMSPLVQNPMGLINCLVRGRRTKVVNDMLWSRYFDEASLEKCLRAAGATFCIVGHTSPTKRAAPKYGFECLLEPAFGQAHGLLLIVNSQSNTFGYLDVDLTRPHGKTVLDLKSPDGKCALRALGRKG